MRDLDMSSISAIAIRDIPEARRSLSVSRRTSEEFIDGDLILIDHLVDGACSLTRVLDRRDALREGDGRPHPPCRLSRLKGILLTEAGLRDACRHDTPPHGRDRPAHPRSPASYGDGHHGMVQRSHG
jgi:hypothetical protein